MNRNALGDRIAPPRLPGLASGASRPAGVGFRPESRLERVGEVLAPSTPFPSWNAHAQAPELRRLPGASTLEANDDEGSPDRESAGDRLHSAIDRRYFPSPALFRTTVFSATGLAVPSTCNS